MQIRDAKQEDLPAIVELLADDELGQKRERLGPPLDSAYQRAFEAIDSDPNHRLMVGVVAGEVVATLQLNFLQYLVFQGGRRAQIEAVRVKSALRGQQLGEQLFLWAIEEARKAGCHIVQLTTNKARGEALRFYEKLGFEASHEGMKLYLQGDVTGVAQASDK